MPPVLFLTYSAFNFTPGTFICEAAAEYDFRIEPVQDGKFPTVTKFRLWYRDLGVVTFTGTVYGIYEDGTSDTAVVTINGAAPSIGTVGAPGTMKQVYLDITKTMMCIQLKLTVAAGAGPLAIIRITGIGELKELSTI